jgi:hypothetical protein
VLVAPTLDLAKATPFSPDVRMGMVSARGLGLVLGS